MAVSGGVSSSDADSITALFPSGPIHLVCVRQCGRVKLPVATPTIAFSWQRPALASTLPVNGSDLGNLIYAHQAALRIDQMSGFARAPDRC